ncbi:MAG: BlaI/MecI/CopY family transcriptional regulator [Lachnospiraceae bacterium]|nr:BlaI/MecI/CopY family transcriptional regulator [Lachnospiraceae bacterium]
MKGKLFESEAKVMEILWREGPLPAKEISLIAADTIGWNKNTTYTVIKKLEAKGFIRRDEPGFVCTALIAEKDIRRSETTSLLTRFFGGSRKALFSALIEDEELTDGEIEELRSLIDKRLGSKQDKKTKNNG